MVLNLMWPNQNSVYLSNHTTSRIWPYKNSGYLRTKLLNTPMLVIFFYQTRTLFTLATKLLNTSMFVIWCNQTENSVCLCNQSTQHMYQCPNQDSGYLSNQITQHIKACKDPGFLTDLYIAITSIKYSWSEKTGFHGNEKLPLTGPSCTQRAHCYNDRYVFLRNEFHLFWCLLQYGTCIYLGMCKVG